MYKDYCVICGKYIPNAEANYEVRGNFCMKCNYKTEKIMAEKRKAKKV